MKYYFKISQVKLNDVWLAESYRHCCRCQFNLRSFPETNNESVLKDYFRFADEATSNSWMEIFKTEFLVTVEYPEFTTGLNAPPLIPGKTLNLTPFIEPYESMYAYEEEIILSRMWKTFFKNFPENILTQAGFCGIIPDMKIKCIMQLIGQAKVTLEKIEE